MKFIGTREVVIKEQYYTLEMERKQLLAIMVALGNTPTHEINNELSVEYNVATHVNTQELYENLTELLYPEEKLNNHSVKMPNPPIISPVKPIF